MQSYLQVDLSVSAEHSSGNAQHFLHHLELPVDDVASLLELNSDHVLIFLKVT